MKQFTVLEEVTGKEELLTDSFAAPVSQPSTPIVASKQSFGVRCNGLDLRRFHEMAVRAVLELQRTTPNPRTDDRRPFPERLRYDETESLPHRFLDHDIDSRCRKLIVVSGTFVNRWISGSSAVASATRS